MIRPAHNSLLCEDADPMDDNGTIAESKQPVIKTIKVSEIND